MRKNCDMRKLNKVKIHYEGLPTLTVSFFLLCVLCGTAYFVNLVTGYIITGLSIVLFLLIVNFFRSPHRTFSGDAHNIIVSSADGTVVALEETYEGEYLHTDVIQVSVFMTIFDVHANWFPVNGEVTCVSHRPGRFHSAWLPKSSSENESSSIVIRTESGQKVLVRQIAGAMARRIVTYAKPGDEASIKDQMGFIKFGSRVDIFMPLDTKLYVKIGDKTVGGITKIGCLYSRE